MRHQTCHITSIAIAFALAVLCFYACGPKKSEKARIEAVTDRSAMPVLDATKVNTVISDSGITRYRIKTPHWQIFDKAEPPYWEFGDGIVLENFDELLNVNASIESDYAKYLEREQLWELDGNVRAINLQGEVFETPQLFWDQKTERIYSDSMIHISKTNSIITGIGFESNQTMTQYTIRNPQGIFPINEKEEDNTSSEDEQAQFEQNQKL